jgi:hypothetical protein
MASGLISGMTSGTSGCMRNADELSMTTAPACTARGANSLLRALPAEKKAISMPLKRVGLQAFHAHALATEAQFRTR